MFFLICGTLRRCLRAPSADRRETFKRGWKCVNLGNVGTKMGDIPKIEGILLHLGANSPSSIDWSPRNFATWSVIGNRWILKSLVQKTSKYSAISDFDRKCPPNGLSHRQAENGIINYDPSYTYEEKYMKFGLLSTEFMRLMFTHQKSTVRPTSDNSTFRSRISLERIKQFDKRQTALLSTTIPSTFNEEKLVYFGPLTKRIRWLIFHQKWTPRVVYRLMQLHSLGGVVTSGISTL